MPRTALVTGGTGFIGSHCCRDLLDHGFSVVAVDNLVNSSSAVLERIKQLGDGRINFHKVDVADRSEIERLIRAYDVDVVVHFAAHKAVGDSVDRPLDYYSNNLTGLTSLLNASHAGGVRHLIFSSSCSIYGIAEKQPITEEFPARPTNPYARTKWMAEIILEDLCSRYTDWSVTALRYFNPAGAHPSGLIGESPMGRPCNIFPLLARVAAERRETVRIYGSDYPTRDGTPIRDYVHVLDVVEGHRLALEAGGTPGFRRYNLGTGVGTTVLELVRAFEEASRKTIPYKVVERRQGDVSALVASADKAATELSWRAGRTLAEMCADTWHFQECNPAGYSASPDGAAVT